MYDLLSQLFIQQNAYKLQKTYEFKNFHLFNCLMIVCDNDFLILKNVKTFHVTVAHWDSLTGHILAIKKKKKKATN